MTKRIALYAGSFDPYTNGHHAIVRKAAALFDEVVVLIGVNVAKRRSFDAGTMAAAMQALFDAEGLNARAVLHAGLVTDYCRENGIRWYVRGLRNGADYDYEEGIAQINRLLYGEMETLYLRSDDPVISSSMIRELLAFGHSVADFVPEGILRIIEAEQRSNT